VKLLLLSFESTLRANLSVGMPLDMLAYEANSYAADRECRFDKDDPYFTKLSGMWGDAIRAAIDTLPNFKFPG